MTDFFRFDDEYVRRLREGDPLIEEHFHEYFRPLLLRKARRYFRSMVDVDDVIQEVLMRVFKAIRAEDGLRDGSRLGAFVNTVAVNVIHEKQRENVRTDQFPENFDPPDWRDVEEMFATRETERIVRQILVEMSGKDAALLRDWFSGRDKDEICDERGVDRGYLRVLVHRALKRFAELYRRRKR